MYAISFFNRVVTLAFLTITLFTVSLLFSVQSSCAQEVVLYPKENVYSARFSDDGSLIVMPSMLGVSLWDVHPGRSWRWGREELPRERFMNI